MMKIRILLLITTLALTVTCRRPLINVQSNNTVGASPVLRVVVDSHILLGDRLRLHWAISNSGRGPIFVYSTFLASQRHVSMISYADVDCEHNRIDIRTTHLSPLPGGVNAFPPAEFLEIGPQETKEGDFTTGLPIGQEVFYVNGDPMTGSDLLKSGAWNLRFAIAYGHEVASVQQALRDSLAVGKEHPINPIVRWQQMIYSEPVSVTFQK